MNLFVCRFILKAGAKVQTFFSYPNFLEKNFKGFFQSAENRKLNRQTFFNLFRNIKPYMHRTILAGSIV